MESEFDEEKSMTNKTKHGIDFYEAPSLWEDPDRVEIPSRVVGEKRYLLIGKIEKNHWSLIFTYRGARVRLISVRRARKEEKAIYES